MQACRAKPRYYPSVPVPTAPRDWQPLFALGAGALNASAPRRDLDCRTAFERADLPGDFDGGNDCRLRIDHGGIRFQAASVQPKLRIAPTKCLDVDVRWSGHLLEE